MNGGSSAHPPYILPLLVLVVTWVVIAWLTPTFRGQASVYSVLNGFPLIGLAALGLAVTIIAGEFDLSVGSMAALSAVSAVLAAPAGLIGCIVIAVAVCTAIGALQGMLIGRLGINSLVFTIGTLILIRGLTWMLANNAPIMLENFEITDPLLLRFGIFSWSSIVAIAIFVLAGFLAYTRWGREIYAIGGARNRRSPPACRRCARSRWPSPSRLLRRTRRGARRDARRQRRPQNYEDLLLGGARRAPRRISLYGGRGTVLNVTLGVAILSVVGTGLARAAPPPRWSSSSRARCC
jgi:ribose/xylose/arabinose/galactoside ABC-type transport system permease subunit